MKGSTQEDKDAAGNCRPLLPPSGYLDLAPDVSSNGEQQKSYAPYNHDGRYRRIFKRIDDFDHVHYLLSRVQVESRAGCSGPAQWSRPVGREIAPTSCGYAEGTDTAQGTMRSGLVCSVSCSLIERLSRHDVAP